MGYVSRDGLRRGYCIRTLHTDIAYGYCTFGVIPSHRNDDHWTLHIVFLSDTAFSFVADDCLWVLDCTFSVAPLNTITLCFSWIPCFVFVPAVTGSSPYFVIHALCHEKK